MADTDIELSVDLNTKDAEKTAEQLQKEIQGIFNSREGQSSSSLTSLELQMKQTAQKAQELRQNLSKIADSQIPTEKYAKLSAEMEKWDTQANSAIEKMSKFEEAGGDINTEKYQEWAKALEHAELAQASLSKRMEKMESSGTAFVSGKTTEEYKKAQVELDKVNDKLKQQIVHHNEIVKKSQETSQKTSKTTKEVEKLKTVTDKVRKSSKNMSSSFSKGFGTVAKVVKKAVMSIGALLLGVQGLMAIFRKLRSTIVEGFKNLETSGVGKLKQQMEDLKNSSTTLKNALAGAFEPIVTMIIPYIQQLVQWLTVAIDKMAQFIATVKGQKTYIRAIQQVGNAAEKTGNQAKRALGPLDNLNVITSSSSSGTSNNMFEEAAIPQETLDKLEKMKAEFEQLKTLADAVVIEPFKKGFFNAFDDWKEKLSTADTYLKKIRTTAFEIFDKIDKSKLLRMTASVSELLGSVAGFFASTTGALILGILGGVEKFYDRNADRIVEFIDNANDLMAQINEKGSELLANVSEIFDVVQEEGFQELISNLLELVYAVSSSAFTLTLQLLLKVITFLNDYLISPNVQEIKSSLNEIFLQFSGVFGELKELWYTIEQLFEDIAKLLNLDKTNWDSWGHVLGLIFLEIIYGVENILRAVNSVIRFILRSVRFFIDTIDKIVNGDWKGIWQNIKDYATETLHDIIDYVKRLMDQLTSLFDKAKEWNLFGFGDLMTKFSDRVNGHTGGGGGRSFDIGAASGAVIPPYVSEHLIKVGDNNVETEIISPLSTMKQAMIEALTTAGAGGSNQEIILQLDGREFMRAMVKQNNEYKKMHGGNSALA